ncbi:hypothetical protein R3P38DRAFT_781905 [Favolaschia claudopus]|uniref:Uncharacterized protein n=1 Tax=Favolaschia claudopus TaxID=2862362 RepID=A0AAW0C5L4_9AGAR
MAHRQHPAHRRVLARRDEFDTPTAEGLTDATVAQEATEIANSLVFNTAATGLPNANTDNIKFSELVTATLTSPKPSSTADADPANANANLNNQPSGAPVSSSSSEISMTTVIGACLGALAGAIIIILVGLWLYRRGTKPRPRSPSNARRAPVDKERAWGKLDEMEEDKWEGKDGNMHTKNGVVSVGPMEKLTMFKKTPSMRTTYTVGGTLESDHPNLPPIAAFDHPFAQYHPGLAEKLAMEEDTGAELAQPRPFLARVEAVPPISWDSDTVGRDSFLSLNSNAGGMTPGVDLALPTPKLTSSEPHHWESAEVMHFEHSAQVENADSEDSEQRRGRASSIVDPTTTINGLPRRKSNHNPFFGARMSTHSTRSTSRSMSRSRASSRAASPTQEDVDAYPMPAPPALAYTREEKGKGREILPPSPRSSTGSMATVTAVNFAGHYPSSINPFSDPAPYDPTSAPTMPSFSYHGSAHNSKDSHDRAMQSLIAALGTTGEDVEERLRVASMQPSMISEVSAYTDVTDSALRESWPVPPSRPQPGQV